MDAIKRFIPQSLSSSHGTAMITGNIKAEEALALVEALDALQARVGALRASVDEKDAAGVVLIAEEHLLLLVLGERRERSRLCCYLREE